MERKKIIISLAHFRRPPSNPSFVYFFRHRCFSDNADAFSSVSFLQKNGSMSISRQNLSSASAPGLFTRNAKSA
ncbi:hypothetical protein X975_12588, partial [Stegodyphus mimosarum]